MPYVTVGKENSADINIHYNDHGSGKPVVLIHGYPLNGNSWEKQEAELLKAGRPGDQLRPPRLRPVEPADDRLRLRHLRRRPQGAARRTWSSARTCSWSASRWAPARSPGTSATTAPIGISRVAMLGVIPPFLLQTDDNEKGVPGEVFEGIKDTVAKDRYLWFEGFFDNFFNTDKLAPDKIGDAALKAHFNVAVEMSPFASYACVDTWLTDFRDDLPKSTCRRWSSTAPRTGSCRSSRRRSGCATRT